MNYERQINNLCKIIALLIRRLLEERPQPLISPPLFDQAQAVRRQRGCRNSSLLTGNQRVYPLSKMLYSWPAGHKMGSVSNHRNQRYYRDRTTVGHSRLDQTALPALQPTVQAEVLEEQVLAILNSLSLPDDWRQRILAYLVSPEGGLAEVERQRHHLLAQFERAKEMYQQGDYTQAQYVQEKNRLEQALAALLVPLNLDNQQIQALLDNPPALWQQATPAELKDLFEAVFQRVYVQGEQLVRFIVTPALLNHLTDPNQRLFGPADDVADDTLHLPTR